MRLLTSQIEQRKPSDVLKEAYEKGRKAFLQGGVSSPYRQNTLLDKEWTRGFDAEFKRNADDRRI